MSRIDSNPFLGTSSSEDVLPSLQQRTSTNIWVDLLTGEDTFSEPISQPVKEKVVNEGSDFLDFLDQATIEFSGAQNDQKHSSSQDIQPPESSSQQYISCLTSLAGPRMVCYYRLHIALSHYIIPCLMPIIK